MCGAQTHTSPQLSFKKENVKSEDGFNYITLCEVINLFLVCGENDEKQEKFQKYCSDCSES